MISMEQAQKMDNKKIKKLIESCNIHKSPAKIYGETIEYETGISVSSRASVDNAIARTIIVAFFDFKTPMAHRTPMTH